MAKSEEAVFQWCVRWWEAGERPEAELLAAMKHVRFAAMDVDFVETTVRAWPALDSREGRDNILGAFLDDARALSRWGFGPRLVYVLGGGGVDGGGEVEHLSTVDVYDPRTDAWKQLSNMPAIRCMHGAAVLDGKIYVMGGLDDVGNILSTADVYDPQSDSWHPLTDMASRRDRFAAAVVSGTVRSTRSVVRAMILVPWQQSRRSTRCWARGRRWRA